MNHDILEKYIERVATIRSQKSDAFEFHELKAIAQELGMTEEDLAAADKASHDHLTRGRQFLEHQRIDDAIVELEESAILSPGQFEPLFYLAVAHRDHWLQSGNRQSKATAESLSRQCIALAPDHSPAYEVLNSLEAPRKSHSFFTKKRIFFILSSVFSLSLLIFAVVKQTEMRKSAAEYATSQIDTSVASNLHDYFAVITESDIPQLEKLTGEIATNTPPETAQPKGEVKIPVTFIAPEEAPELSLNIRLSLLNNYSTGSSFYKVHGVIENQTSREIDSLRLAIEYLDVQGNTAIPTKYVDAIQSYHVTLRPGDIHAFTDLQRANPQLASVVLRVETIKSSPASRRYPGPQPIEPDWQVPAPEPGSIDFRVRNHNVSHNSLLNRSFLRLGLEVHNHGPTIRQMKMRVEYRDKSGKVLREDEKLVVSRAGVSQEPGEIRLVPFLGEVPSHYDHYKFYITEFD